MLAGAVLRLRRTAEAWAIATGQHLHRGGQLALHLLYPPRCAFCGDDARMVEGDLLFCERCAGLLGPEVWLGCRRCGAALATPGTPSEDCGHCRGRRWAFESVVALGAYQAELREAVLRTKRPPGNALATMLGRLHVRRRQASLHTLQADLVVPVPMHWARYLARGTKGVELLAEQIAAGLGLPLEAGALYLARNIRPQHHLAPAERIRNVRNAFRLRRGYDLRGATILLVDDVLTTGATASEAARVLKRKAAAARVAVAVVARAAGSDWM